MDTLPIVTGIAGFVILWGAIRNKNPLKAIQLALQGQDPNTAPPLYVAAAPAGAVPSEELPGTPQPGDDARTDPPGFEPGPNTYVVPILPNEAAQGGGVL